MNKFNKSETYPIKIKPYALALTLIWSAIVTASLLWNVYQSRQGILDVARIQARNSFIKDVIYRRWNAGHGGVYVPVTDKTPSNPYLEVPERDITTHSGVVLTLMNPAYMTRQVHELSAKTYGIQGHITSLNPIRPANAPDPWEIRALEAFQYGAKEISSIEEAKDDTFMRLMRPLVTEKGCLKCHAAQGYKIGDIRGGISLSVPMSPLWAIGRSHLLGLSLGHSLLWLVGLVGIGLGSRRLSKQIAERKKAEEALQFTQFAVDRSSDAAFWMGSDARFIYVNEEVCRALGYSKGELLQMTVHDIDPDFPQEVWPDHWAEVKRRGSFIVESHHRTKEGRIFPVEITVNFLEFGGNEFNCAFARDITERKQAEKALRQEEEKFRVLVEESPLGISFIGEDGKYKYINPKFIEIFGYTLEDISTGKEWFKKAYPDSDYRHQAISTWINDYKESKVGESRPRTFKVTCKDGSEKIIHFKPVTLETGDHFVIYEDMTDQERLEDQLRQAQKMESIGTLAGGIAHDFNNILSSVIGYTELALDDIEKGSLLHYHIQEVLTSGLRASDLVKQILTFSRQADQELKPLKVQLVIKEVLKLMRASLPSTIEIKQHVSNKCGLVMADDTQIHQIAMNLMTNAYQAMEDEGGKMEVTLKEVDLGVEDLKDQSMTPGAYVCLTVADTGIGMEKSVLERIFDPYYSTKEKDKGTGLGLAVVHGIVKSYKGDIRVYSEPGEGTAFYVYLPVIKTQAETEEIDTITPVQKGTERILLVDDEEPIVRMETQMLERLGYHVTARTSSIEALEAFRAAPDQFDLVITDMTMPNMTGDILAKELINIRSDIPVILCTGFSEKMSKNKVDAFGIKGFLMKPIAKSDLAKTVREVLDES